MLPRDILTKFKVQIYHIINIQSIVLCISEQKLYRHLEGKAACYKKLCSGDLLFLFKINYVWSEEIKFSKV